MKLHLKVMFYGGNKTDKLKKHDSWLVTFKQSTPHIILLAIKREQLNDCDQ